MSTHTDSPKYKRPKDVPATFTKEVQTAYGTATFEFRNVTIAGYRGLDDAIAGELPEGLDPTGRKYLSERILKLERVTARIADIDDDDLRDTGGDVKKILRLPGNEDLAWLAFDVFAAEIFGRHSKSGNVSPRGGDADGGTEAPEGRQPDAPMRSLRGEAAAAD